MSLPPHARLERVIAALARHLPEQVGTLLAAPRFADDAAALTRLATDVRAVVSRLPAAEAERLADLLCVRWARIGTVRLPPAAGIEGPAVVWMRDAPIRVPVTVAVDGLDAGWTARWANDAVGEGARGVLVARPDADEAVATVRVEGRGADGRTVLRVRLAIPVRRPRAIIAAERVRLVDAHDVALAGVALTIGDATVTTDPHGIIERTADMAGAVRLDALVLGQL